MNELERSLGNLLDSAAGQPPRDVEVGSVLARARRQRVQLAAVATGAVAVVGVAAVASVGLLQGSTRPTHRVQLAQSPTATPSAAATAPPVCTGAASRASVISTQGAAGTIRWVVRVVNTSGATCTSRGYPSLAFHSASGWFGGSTRHGGYQDINGTPTRQVVPAGGSLYAVAYWSDVTNQSGGCRTFDRARLTLPGSSTPVALAARGCVTPGSVRVGPVTAHRPQQ